MRAPTAHDRADFWCVFFYVSGAVRSVIWPTYIPISNSSRSVLHDRIHRRVEEERKKTRKRAMQLWSSGRFLHRRVVITHPSRQRLPYIYIYLYFIIIIYIFFLLTQPVRSSFGHAFEPSFFGSYNFPLSALLLLFKFQIPSPVRICLVGMCCRGRRPVFGHLASD